MARKRDTTTLGDLKGLKRLEKEYQGKPEAARITMLRLLRDEPDRSINDIAIQIGYSVPTVKRWMKIYRSEGLDALIQLGARGRQEDVDEDLERLSKKIAAGEFGSLMEVRQWMDRHDMHRNDAAANGDVVEKRSTTSGRRKTARRSEKNGSGAGNYEYRLAGVVIPEKVFKLLNNLSTAHDVVEWAKEFRPVFQEFLGDVDRITITVNIQRNVINPEAQDVVASLSKNLNLRPGGWVLDHLSPDSYEEENRRRYVLNQLRPDFPHDDYHPPRVLVLYYRDQFFMGGMILWRLKDKPPISQQTLAVVEQLKPFLTFLYSDLAARHQLSNPREAVINEIMKEVTTNAELTWQEQRVLMMQLLGFSYEEMAEQMNISINTVRSHVKSMYTKTKAHGPAQFLAKYLAPKLKDRKL